MRDEGPRDEKPASKGAGAAPKRVTGRLKTAVAGLVSKHAISSSRARKKGAIHDGNLCTHSST